MTKLKITIALEYDLNNFYGSTVYDDLEMTADQITDDIENTVYDDLLDLMRGDRLRSWAEAELVEATE